MVTLKISMDAVTSSTYGSHTNAASSMPSNRTIKGAIRKSVLKNQRTTRDDECDRPATMEYVSLLLLKK